MNIADSFYRITQHRYLYNITSLDNIPSIIQRGILCFNSADNIHHTSIALSGVQLRRNNVQVPGGLKLHDYANLYFTYHNPMLYRRQDQADCLCILAVSAEVLDIDDCVVSDRNAAAELVRFYSAEEGIKKLDFEKIYAKYWTHENPFEQNNLKAIKCAEVLVPHHISYEYIVGACVVSDEVANILKASGFDRKISVNPQVFYR